MTRALILAAGQGSRLMPLTSDRPKCLVPLSGKSLLQRQVKTLRAAGVNDIHIVTGYFAQKIAELGFDTSYNPRFAQTNMVESMFCALDFVRQEGDLIIAYGDIVYEARNLNAVLACEDEIALMIDARCLRQADPLDDAETLVMDDRGYVIELGKKPDGYDRIQGQYTGLIKICGDKIPDLIDFYQRLDRDAIYDGKDFDNMYMTSFLQLLIDAGWNAKAVMVDNGWLEIDSVEDLSLYESLAENGLLDKYYKMGD